MDSMPQKENRWRAPQPPEPDGRVAETGLGWRSRSEGREGLVFEEEYLLSLAGEFKGWGEK